MTVRSTRRQRVLSALFLTLFAWGGHAALQPQTAWAKFRIQSSRGQQDLPELKSVRLSPDGHALGIESVSPLEGRDSRVATVLRFQSPNRVLVDIPNTRLASGAMATIPVSRNGIERIELTEIVSDFYNAVRAIIYVQDEKTLSGLNPVLEGNTLRLNNENLPSSQPATTASAARPNQKQRRGNAPAKTSTKTAQNAVAQPLPPVATPLPGMSPALKISPTPPAFGGVVPAASPLANGPARETPPAPSGPLSIFGTPLRSDINVIESVALKDHKLVVQARNGNQLRVKNKMVLTAPSRLVVDIENSILANRSLLGTISGSSSDKIRQVRIGQFDEQTVRLVIEAPSPELFEAVFNGKDRDSMMLMPTIASASSSPSSATGNARPGEVESIDLKRDHGGTLLRLEASSPIQHRIIRKDNKITLELLNEAGNPTNIGFDNRQFPEIEKMRLDSPTPTNSRLLISLANPNVRLVPTVSDDGKTLELLMINAESTAGLNLPSAPVVGSNLTRLEQDLAANLPPAGDAPFPARIVIDAGHGGKDIGANRSGVNEKDLNLSLALMLRDALVAKGFKVYMTRSTDVFLPLPQITAITNQINPDLFISIHHNASVNVATHGIETYYYTPQSIPLAKRVHVREIKAVGERDGGVKQARFYVIHHTSVPAILCEVGYVSNPAELTSLQGMERKQKTAQSIADGVVDYLKSRMSAWAKSAKARPAQL